VARVAEIDKTAAWVLIAEGFDEFKANHRDGALAAFQAAKKDGFPDSLPYVLLENMYSHDGELERAESEIMAGLAELPDDAALLNAGVFTALLKRNRRIADERFSALQRTAAGSREAVAASCLYYYGTNQAQLAVPACENSLRGAPENPTAHSNYGWAALDANQFEVAFDQYAEAAKWYKDRKLTALQTIDLAWGVIIAKYYSGDKKTASEFLQNLRKDYPDSTTVQGLQHLPLVWSDTALIRIQHILDDVQK